MQYALALQGSNKANFLVEGHDELIFTESWFEPLMDHFKPHVGLLMPFVWNGSDPSMTPDDLAAVVAPLRQGCVSELSPSASLGCQFGNGEKNWIL